MAGEHRAPKYWLFWFILSNDDNDVIGERSFGLRKKANPFSNSFYFEERKPEIDEIDDDKLI